MSRAPIAADITTPTTAAIVLCTEPRFTDAAGNENADFITMTFTCVLNGITPGFGDSFTFARNATQADKQTALRTRLNSILQVSEPTVTLNNVNIQISGLPV